MMPLILIVDDKEDNLYYLQSLLQGHGYRVEAAHEGVEALALARRSAPDFVISDLLMPVMDGYTLLREWKADVDLRHIPFIVYTATYTAPEDKQLALKLGADAFILKPAEPDAFIAILQEVSARQQTLLPASNPSPAEDRNILKRYSETLIRKLEEKTLQLEQSNHALSQELVERTTVEQELLIKNRMLKTLQEASLDGILMVGADGRLLSCNQNFMDLWELSVALTGEEREEPFLQQAAERVLHKDAFLERVEYLNAHREERSSDEILLKDGRIIDRYSAPITGLNGEYYGRAWYFRDLTAAKHAQQSLRNSEREQRQLAQLLEGERARLSAAQRVAKVGSWETDLQTMRLIWSEETYRIFEVEPEKFGHTHPDFLRYVHPEDINALEDAFAESIRLRADHLMELEHRLLLPDGRIKFVEERWNVLSDAQARPLRAVGTCQDITDRKLIENGVKRLNRVLTFVSEMNSLIVRVSSRDELFREACRIASSVGGFRMSLITILDHRTLHLVPIASAGKNDDLLAEVTRILASSGSEQTMIVRAMRDQRVVLSNDSQHDTAVVLGDSYARYGINSIANFPLVVSDEAVGVLTLYSAELDFFHEDEIALLTQLTGDIEFAIDHIDKQERLNYLAYYDELTGLANRTLFFERVGQFIRGTEQSTDKLAFFLIDLERFKNFNDSLGRANGDDLLKKVAGWLIAQTGNVNLLARIGADQFAIALPGITTESEVARQVDSILSVFVKHSLLVDNTEFRISAKIGIALFPNDGTEVENLFRNAEAALKMAKKTGDRYLFHNRRMTDAVTGKLSLENQLRLAIEHEEFVLHYQPKFHLADGTLSGAEALIRWNKPGSGLIAPGDFIPLLEETGMIYEVGRWALRQAIADASHWRTVYGVSVRIAVNVSALQLRNPEFISEIRRKIEAVPDAARGLEIEITESMIMEDIEESITKLQAIREMGITIAIDDFGTGFSSLAYLSRLPLNTLKIDRSFIVGMQRGAEGVALVSTIVNLAHSLKLKVVAEGVETKEQSGQLAHMHCDEIQGFLRGRPTSAEEFEANFMPSAGNAPQTSAARAVKT